MGLGVHGDMIEPRIAASGEEYQLELKRTRPFGWSGTWVLLGESYGGFDLTPVGNSWRLTRKGIIKALRRQVAWSRSVDEPPDEVLRA